MGLLEMGTWGPGDGDLGGRDASQGVGTQGWDVHPVGKGGGGGRVPVPIADTVVVAAWGDGCSSFGNLFTEIAENSAHGSLVARLPSAGDTGSAGLQLCLVGADAIWFYLDGRSVRLNVSAGRALDREVLPPTQPLHWPHQGSSCLHPVSSFCPSCVQLLPIHPSILLEPILHLS